MVVPKVHEESRILIIDDDVDLCKLMRTYLEQQGFAVHVTHDGTRAINEVSRTQPDLIVLDLMLPGTDGLTVCRSLRQQFLGPILMFTALKEEIDEVVGLETGADDYLKKPVSPRLLLARIRALLRRGDTFQLPSSNPDTEIVVGDVLLNRNTRSIYLDGSELTLSTVEFDLFALLIANAGEVLTRQDIYQAMRQLDYDGLDRSIDMYISRLRRKLGEGTNDKQLIKTVRGSGYLFIKESC